MELWDPCVGLIWGLFYKLYYLSKIKGSLLSISETPPEHMKTRSNSASPCDVTYKKRTYKKRKTKKTVKKTKEETIRIEMDTIIAEVIAGPTLYLQPTENL